ncbi:hypothetical protein AB7M17_007185 [Bradyrhizobium sp. USDA 377]
MLFSPQLAIRRANKRPSGGGGVTPPPVSGLIGWWDASQTSTLTLSGSTITNVADASGNGNHLGDGSTSTKPSYNATGFNSRPAIVVSSGHALASTNPFPLGTGNTLTFFFVGTLTTSAASNARAMSYFDHVASDYSSAGGWIFFRNGTGAAAGIMRNTVSTVQSISYSTPYRWIGTVDSSGVMKIYVNGTSTGSATQSGNWITNGALGIGVSISDGSYWDGAIAECGIATAFTNSTDVATLDAFLQAKWGL